MTFLSDHVQVIAVDLPGAPTSPAPATCDLTGVDGENPDDCTTHDHVEPGRPAPRLIHTKPDAETSLSARTVSLVWEVSSSTEDDVAKRNLAILSIWHRPGAFYVSLNSHAEESYVSAGRPITSRLCAPFDLIQIAIIPCARFSARGMADACKAGLIALVNRADDPNVKAIFGE